jgi:hypothetical protein
MSFIQPPPEEHPLEAFVHGGKLHITIGTVVLMNALRIGEVFAGDPPVRVSDSKKFIDALAYQLGEEDDDGSTPIHHMLESAARRAIEQACDGVEVE